MARLPRRKGKILFSNLTRNLAEGESPDTEFIYLIMDNLPSLSNSQVYVHRNDIIEGRYDSSLDGTEVEFAPEEVSQEKYENALLAGSPIRKYVGRDVVLDLVSAESSHDSSFQQTDKISKDKKNQGQKIEYSLDLTPHSEKRFSIAGKVNKQPAGLTYVISATGLGSDQAWFELLNSDEVFGFEKFHPGLHIEDGMADFEVEYPTGTLDIEVRCIESNIISYLTLRK